MDRLPLRSFLIILLCYFFNNVYSQNILYFLKNSGQSAFFNPIISDTNKIVFLLPCLSFNIYSPDFRLKQLLKPDAEGNLSMSEVAENRIQPTNRMSVNTDVQTLGLSFRVNKKLFLNVHHAVAVQSAFNIDGEVVKVAFKGLGNYVGNTYDFKASIDASAYNTLGVGASYQLAKNIQLGARVKYLNGILGFFTESGKSRVTFENYDYAMSFDNNINAYDFAIKTIDEGNILRGGVLNKNKGVAFDLGLNWQLPKLRLSVGINDALGRIHWKSEGVKYSSIGNHYFKGINSNSLFESSTTQSLSVSDSVKNVMGLTETQNIHYTQKLPYKIYFNAIYDINSKVNIGGLIHYAHYEKDFEQTNIMLNVGYNISNRIQLGSSLNCLNGLSFHYGMYMQARFKKLQIIAASDNILGAFQPFNSRYTNAHVGLNYILTAKALPPQYFTY